MSPEQTVYGYAGRILRVDLSSRRAVVEPLDPALARTYLGGFGLNNKIAYDALDAGVDPLSPANPIVIGAGVLGGTLAPSTSKIMATTKFPATRAVGTGFGGSMGDMLKTAGYDHVVITGASDTPVFLKISDDEVEFCDAGDLWGKDILATTDEIRGRFGTHANVFAIGPAGENGVKFSFTIVNKISTLGRGGLGAVMGAKKLKAVVVMGTRGVQLYDRAGFMRLVDPLVDSMRKLSYRDDWVKVALGITQLRKTRVEPHSRNNWSEAASPTADEAERYGLDQYFKIWRNTIACPTCVVGCKAQVQIQEGDQAGQLVPMSDVQHGISTWRRFEGGDFHKALSLRTLCNEAGLDDQTASNIIDFAVDLYENQIITRADTDGLELKRDYDTATTLLWGIIKRKGLGEILANGFQESIEAFGKEASNYAVTVKGLEPFYDPRVHFDGMTITMMTNPRGSYVISGNSPGYVMGRKPQEFARFLTRLGVGDDAVARIVSEDPPDVNMGRLVRYTEDWYAVCSALGICMRQPVVQCYTIETAARLYSLATGFETTASDLMRGGEIGWTVLKMANAREGFTRKDDRLPDRFFEPLKVDGQTVPLRDYYGHTLDRSSVDKLLDAYYEERGWSAETGLPTAEKLRDLGIA